MVADRLAIARVDVPESEDNGQARAHLDGGAAPAVADQPMDSDTPMRGSSADLPRPRNCTDR